MKKQYECAREREEDDNLDVEILEAFSDVGILTHIHEPEDDVTSYMHVFDALKAFEDYN